MALTTAPVITFTNGNGTRSVTALSSITFVQSTLGSNFLPVLQGEQSIPVTVRVYNNYALASNIATAFNLNVTVYDGVGSASHTATQSVTAQSWIRVYETGFGESTTPPGLYTAWTGSTVAIGGTNVYFAEVGSDGLYSDQIRAGSNTNGCGFIEFALQAQIPLGAATANYNFSFSVSYEWVD